MQSKRSNQCWITATLVQVKLVCSFLGRALRRHVVDLLRGFEERPGHPTTDTPRSPDSMIRYGVNVLLMLPTAFRLLPYISTRTSKLITLLLITRPILPHSLSFYSESHPNTHTHTHSLSFFALWKALGKDPRDM